MKILQWLVKYKAERHNKQFRNNVRKAAIHEQFIQFEDNGGHVCLVSDFRGRTQRRYFNKEEFDLDDQVEELLRDITERAEAYYDTREEYFVTLHWPFNCLVEVEKSRNPDFIFRRNNEAA